MTNYDNKNCECRHIKHDHILQVGNVTKWAFLGEGFFRTPQVGNGLCKKCMCPKFRPRTFLNSRKVKEYPPRENTDLIENRCNKCGRLFESHENAGHIFKK